MTARHSLGRITCLLLLLASCKPKADHLSHEEMERVLLDIHLAETYSTMAGKGSTKKEPGIKNQDSLAVWYHAIFDHHHITAAQFSQSMDWYREHPDELDTVYSHITRELSKTEDKSRLPHVR